MDFSVQTWVVYCVLIAIVSLAALLDYKNHRIPNWLSFAGWYLGPILYLSLFGTTALPGSLIGLLVVLVLTFPLFAMKWMGAGDVKLMTSVGALVGSDHALMFLLSIIFTGLFVALAQLLMSGVFVSYVRRYWMMLVFGLTTGKLMYVEPDVEQQQIIMPYGISIAIGTFSALLFL